LAIECFVKKTRRVKEMTKGSGLYHYNDEAISYFETQFDPGKHKIFLYFF